LHPLSNASIESQGEIQAIKFGLNSLLISFNKRRLRKNFTGIYIKELVLHPLSNHQVFTSEFFGDEITPDFMLHLSLSYHYTINFGGSFEANSPYG